MQVWVADLMRMLSGYVPNALAAIGILLGGWLVALAISGAASAVLRRLQLDARLNRWSDAQANGDGFGVERWITRIIYYLALLFVLIAFFQVLGLTAVTDPLNRLLGEMFGFAPRLLGAGALVLLAWVVAGLVRLITLRVLTVLKLDQRLRAQAGVGPGEEMSVARSLSAAAYWLIFLLFLPAVLDALALTGLLGPVQELLNKVLLALPHMLAAGLILLAGWLFARIAQQVVTNLLSAAGVDRGAEQAGLTRVLGHQRVSHLVGLIVYVLILLPTLIAALDALRAEAIARPASQVLAMVLGAIPAIFAALLILGVAYAAARVAYSLITPLLRGLGVDTWPARLGLGQDPVPGQRTLSDLIGYLVVVAIMLFAVVEAAGMLGFAGLAALVMQFIRAAGQVIVGLMVFGLGLYAAQIAAGAVLSASGRRGQPLSLLTRVVIIVFAGAMALNQMGIAGTFINLAFGIIIGAVALAAAVAFGIGGRDIAARELERWVNALRREQE